MRALVAWAALTIGCASESSVCSTLDRACAVEADCTCDELPRDQQPTCGSTLNVCDYWDCTLDSYCVQRTDGAKPYCMYTPMGNRCRAQAPGPGELSNACFHQAELDRFCADNGHPPKYFSNCSVFSPGVCMSVTTPLMSGGQMTNCSQQNPCICCNA
jgi:hypothetical protein